MKERGQDRLNRIVDGVISGEKPTEMTSNESVKYDQLSKLARTLKSQFSNAPQDLIDRASSIMPKRERAHLSLRILTNPLGFAGARLQSGQDTQAVFEAGEAKVRVMYSKGQNNVLILGEVNVDGWTVTCNGQEVECDASGRFQFEVKSFDSTGLKFESNDAEFSVPSLEELTDNRGQLD